MKINNELYVYMQFLRDRITELRIKCGVSESQMSVELCYSKGYIQSITSGRTMPSMEGFLNICDYCNITPQAFWETCMESEEDDNLRRLLLYAKELSKEKLNTLITVARDMSE